jgi:hypothetical protein
MKTPFLMKTNAIKIQNRGGGFKSRTVTEKTKDAYGRDIEIRHHEVSTERQKGSDYVVFNCPWVDCGARNKNSVYEAKNITAEKNLTFCCKKCLREVEVAKPAPEHVIVVPGMVSRPTPSGLYGPDNTPIR